MATTANISVTKIDSAQAQKEVTANEAFDVFDAALSEKAITMTDADYTLSTSTTPQEWQYKVIKLTGTLTANRNVIVPTNKKEYTVVNATTGGFSIVFKTSGTGVTISNGVTALVRCDGTNIAEITPGAGVGSGTVTSVNITQPAAGITASGGPITTSGSITLALANDLAAVEGLSATGLVRRTGTDAWSAGTTVATSEIADDAITYAKIQNVSATDKVLGRSSSGAGDVEEITCTSFARSILDDADAATVRATIGAASATQPFCLGLFYPGVPTASVLVAEFAAPSGIATISFDAAIAGSSGKALTAATAQTDFDVRKNATTSANGTSVGTIRFAAAGTVPTFIAASGFTLTGGSDWLTVWAPATPDVTLADIGVTLYGTR